MCNLRTPPSSTTETNITSLSTLPPKMYNFKVVHKYNIVEGMPEKLKPTQSGIARVTRCQFFCFSDIAVGLFQYYDALVLLMTLKMFKILLKLPQLTVMCRCNSSIWMFLVLALSFFGIGLGSKFLSSTLSSAPSFCSCPRPRVPCLCPWPCP